MEEKKEITSALYVPADFSEWCSSLHEDVRRKLSIHHLRGIWDGIKARIAALEAERETIRIEGIREGWKAARELDERFEPVEFGSISKEPIYPDMHNSVEEYLEYRQPPKEQGGR